MKRDLLARHRGYLFLGFILGAYLFWHAIWFGAGPQLPSCRLVPMSAETLGMLGILFLFCLLPLPVLLQVARATKSVMLRSLALLGYAKGFSAMLLGLATVISFGDFPRRDLIAHHCLRRADPLRCAAELEAAGGKNRLFTRAQFNEIRRVADVALDVSAPGTKGEKVSALYGELRAAYAAGNWDEVQKAGISLLRLSPGYRDTAFYLRSASVEKMISNEAGRAEELGYWASRPGRGVKELEREALALLPKARGHNESKVRLVRLLKEIHARNPASVVGRDAMHELGIWERELF